MIVRDAHEKDWPDILRMGRAFAEAAWQPEVDEASLRAAVESLPILKVAENGSVCGVAGALVYPQYWNTSQIVAQELFWYVDPKARGTRAGLMLLEALENEARAFGAKRLLMICLDAVNPEGVERLYRRRGYEPMERTFAREL